MDSEIESTRYYAEAAVGIAKSSVFLNISEDEVKRNEIISASISAYYSIFHLSLALIWLFTDSLPENLKLKVSDLRDKGNELPSSDITHRRIEEFLCKKQLKLSNTTSLCKLFRRAQELRVFCNYGPRVTWPKDNPIVGPCNISIDDVKTLVSEIRPVFIETLKIAAPETGAQGDIACIALHQSIDIIRRPGFPFIGWTSSQVHEGALAILQNIYKEVLEMK